MGAIVVIIVVRDIMVDIVVITAPVIMEFITVMATTDLVTIDTIMLLGIAAMAIMGNIMVITGRIATLHITNITVSIVAINIMHTTPISM